jgi:hypothetical protein
MNSVFSMNGRKAPLRTPVWVVFLFWLGLGLVTSLPGLASRTPYYDEVFETRMALLPVSEQILQYAVPDELMRTSPPLYHLLLHPLLLLFGTTSFAIRSIAWLSGGISVALVYCLLENLFVSPWPVLGTLGFMLSSWHLSISQTARQHGLFVGFVLLGLLLFIHTERRGKRFILYSLVLAAACHTSYWGVVVVLPAHLVATWLMRKRFTYWRRAMLSQVVAGLTTLPYLLPILRGYTLAKGGSHSWPTLTIPYFGSLLVDFSTANPGQFELFDLPWVATVTLLVSGVIAFGVICWRREREPGPRWLGLCFAACSLLLFLGYLAAAFHMAWTPLIRKFAILQIPLLIAFLYGICHISQSTLRYGLFFAWAISTAVCGLRFMNSDLYRSSQLIADKIAQLPTPVTTFLNFDTSLPAEEGSLAFLLERMEASRGHEFRSFDFTSMDGQIQISEKGTICFSYMSEGGYLQDRLAKIMRPGASVDGRAAELNHAMQEIISRFHEKGWDTVVTQYYPGRISYQLACFRKGSETSGTTSRGRLLVPLSVQP